MFRAFFLVCKSCCVLDIRRRVHGHMASCHAGERLFKDALLPMRLQEHHTTWVRWNWCADLLSPYWVLNLANMSQRLWARGCIWRHQAERQTPWTKGPDARNEKPTFWTSLAFKRGAPKNETTDSSRTTTLFQKRAACIPCYMPKRCFIALGLKDARSSNYDTFQEYSYLHHKLLSSKYALLSFCIHKNVVKLWKTYFACLHIRRVLHTEMHVVKRALRAQRGSFWHRSRHVSIQWKAPPFEKKCAFWREHSCQRDASLLPREQFKVFEDVLAEGFCPTISISIYSYKSIGCLCSCTSFWHILKSKSKTKLPHLCPKPLSLPKDTCCIFHKFFYLAF